MKKIFLINALFIIVLVLLFDLAAYFLLPPRFAYQFPEYRKSIAPDAQGRGRYPQGYFVKHAQRGFDIGPGQRGEHWVSGVSYPIWANKWGCFDDELQESESYVYFAGDSFTWGYTPFAQKFGSLVDDKSSTRVFKCGVTHSGQRHQLDKFEEVVAQVGNAPSALFVFFYWNDVINDFAFPHTTIIDGWQVDTVSLDKDENLVRHTDDYLQERVAEGLKKIELEKAGRTRISHKVKLGLLRHSLALNLVRSMKHRFSAAEALAVESQDNSGMYRDINSISIERDGQFWYHDNPMSLENQQALHRFSQLSQELGFELVVIIIPPREKATDTQWSEQFRQFLTKSDIQHLDLAQEFSRLNFSADDLYWSHDGHFHPGGNATVAEILMQSYPELLPQVSAKGVDD